MEVSAAVAGLSRTIPSAFRRSAITTSRLGLEIRGLPLLVQTLSQESA
jgi:hypothetical protein